MYDRESIRRYIENEAKLCKQIDDLTNKVLSLENVIKQKQEINELLYNENQDLKRKLNGKS